MVKRLVPLLGVNVGMVHRLVVRILNNHCDDSSFGSHDPIGERNGVLTMAHVLLLEDHVPQTC